MIELTFSCFCGKHFAECISLALVELLEVTIDETKVKDCDERLPYILQYRHLFPDVFGLFCGANQTVDLK